MKPYNRKLLATSGLFVAFCALTSFNPFSQLNHVAQIEKEESITLAQSSPSRSTERDDVGEAKVINGQLKKKMEALKANQSSGTEKKEEAKKTEKQENNEEAKPVQSSKAELESKTEGGTCVDKDGDGKCDLTGREMTDMEKILAKLSPEEQEILKVGKHKDDSIESRESFCEGNGSSSVSDYSERISCFEKSKKGLKKKSEAYGLLMEDVGSLIEEITFDEELKTSQAVRLLKKMTKLVGNDRDLRTDLQAAIASKEASKYRDAFEKNLERNANAISNLDNQINQLKMYDNGMNPNLNYQLNMLSIQRKQMVNNIEREIGSFKQAYRSSLPTASSDDSAFISQLRENMSADYEAIVAPVAQGLSDQSLASLDAQPVALGKPAIDGSVYTSGNSPAFNSQIQPLNQQQGSNYNSLDPNMVANANLQQLRTMSPQQQLQMNNSGNFANNNMRPMNGNPMMNNQMPMNQGPRNGIRPF